MYLPQRVIFYGLLAINVGLLNAATTASDPGVTFAASFDDVPDAQSAKGDYQATLKGTATYEEGRNGKALVTGKKGCNCKFEIQNNLPLSEGALQMWVKPRDWTRDEGKWHFFFQIGKGQKNRPWILLYKQLNETIRLLWQKNAESGEVVELLCKLDATWDKASWHSLVVTWVQDGDQCKVSLYVDGRMTEKRTGKFVIQENDLDENTFTIGDFPSWNPSSEAQTLIDDFRIYNRMLTPAEIEQVCRP